MAAVGLAVPLVAVSVFVRATGPQAVAGLVSCLEFAVAVASLALLPGNSALLPAGFTIVCAAATAVFAGAVAWDAANPDRSALATHPPYVSGGGEVFGCAQRCACGHEAVDRTLGRGRAHVRRVNGTASHGVLVDAGNAPVHLTVRDGQERVDVFAVLLQSVGYDSTLLFCAFAAFGSGGDPTAASSVLAALALMLLAAATAVRVPINLKTQCAYVSQGRRTRAVHFFVLVGAVAATTLASVAVAARFLGPGVLAAYALVVGLGSLLACAASQPVPCERVVDDAHPALRFVHSAELYTASWWHFRLAAEGAWWTWLMVPQLAGAGWAAAPFAGASGVGGPQGEAAGVALSAAALLAAALLAFDTLAHGVPEFLRVVAAVPHPPPWRPPVGGAAGAAAAVVPAPAPAAPPPGP